MKTPSKSDLQVHKLTAGAFLVCTPQANVLFGCPPEILKRILAAHLPMPETVVVPETLHHGHCSQASLEFPLYHFLFVQRGLERGRRFQVVANARQAKGLEEMLRVTVVGPNDREMTAVGTAAQRAQDLFRESSYMALKNPATNAPFTIPEMINFFPLHTGEQCVLYPVRGKMPQMALERTGDTSFRVFYGEEAHAVELAVGAEPTPNYPLKRKPFDGSPGQLKVTVLGRSNGFDPKDPANGYLVNLDGKVLLWDCPAYLHQHLRALKVDPKTIDAVVLSHVHEDHIDVSESLRDPPFELYATPEVYFSLLVKLAAVYGCSQEEAKRFHRWHPIEVDKPMRILGADVTFFHSVHAIPAVGCRLTMKVGRKPGVLHISGDHLSMAALKAMHEKGGISDARHTEMLRLLKGDETLVLMDAGGGIIHGDYRDYLDRNTRVAFMHTGIIPEDLPAGKELVKSGQVLDVLA
ncbi:MAG: MBL fold metallo-hydrolase [Candidatus Lambdaproteobacteria bacterium]|nr:MBL fold metallo-hydrolase [Candidatus Lambdaproteobacteria bacterium]